MPISYACRLWLPGGRKDLADFHPNLADCLARTHCCYTVQRQSFRDFSSSEMDQWSSGEWRIYKSRWTQKEKSMSDLAGKAD